MACDQGVVVDEIGGVAVGIRKHGEDAFVLVAKTPPNPPHKGEGLTCGAAEATIGLRGRHESSPPPVGGDAGRQRGVSHGKTSHHHI
jgi:hypothetical protein